MKNIYKLFLSLVVIFSFNSCDNGAGLNEGKFNANPELGWVDFDVAVPARTLSPITTQITIPLEINAPINASDLIVNFDLVPVAGGDPSSVISSTFRSVTIPAGELTTEIVLEIADLVPLISNNITVEFDVTITSTSRSNISVGLDDGSQITSYRVSTPCPIGLTSTYIGTSVYQPDGANFTAQNGYTVTVTEVAGMDLTYDVDTSWGPNYVSVLCGCVANGDYPGPIRFTIDPSTFDITVIQGGEPSGQGYTFDLNYGITGTGSYDTCNNIIVLDLFDETLFEEPVGVVLLPQ